MEEGYSDLDRLQQELAGCRQAQKVLVQRQAELEAFNKRLRGRVMEMHHLHRRHLQIFKALMEIQESYDDPLAANASGRLYQYIHAVAGVYSLQPDDGIEVVAVSLMQFVDILKPHLGGTGQGEALSFEIEELQISVFQCLAIASLLHELVSNALKHGLGLVEVRVKTRGDRIVLAVLDQGAGFPADFDPVASGKIGLELVKCVAELELKGSVHFENRVGGGAHVSVEIPRSVLTKTPG